MFCCLWVEFESKNSKAINGNVKDKKEKIRFKKNLF